MFIRRQVTYNLACGEIESFRSDNVDGEEKKVKADKEKSPIADSGILCVRIAISDDASELT